MSGPDAMTGRERFLAACRGEAVDATPVWYMRQAGGRLPRHVALRERHSVLEIASDPRLCAEVSVAAVDELGVDGAVMYADIMLLAGAMGVRYELTDRGPIVDPPLRSADAVGALRVPDPAADLGSVLEAIRLARAALGDRAAIIGIAGGPFTLAAYLVEGAPSRDHLHARAMMAADAPAWHELAGRIATATIAYLEAQVAAGADIVQLFDTWASSLTGAEYDAFVAPYVRRILASMTVPTIHHVARSEVLLPHLATLGATVVGIDSRQSLATARERLGAHQAVQGNLDAATVLAGWPIAAAGAESVLAAAGPIGHIFNLGEPVPRDADPTILRDLASLVHDVSAAVHQPSRGS